MKTDSKNGLACAVAAYVLWGVLPVYWKMLQTVPAYRILCHRIVWSFFFLAGLVLLRQEWGRLWSLAFKPRILGIYIFAAILISVNWLTYIWAVNAGRIVDTSLGYFVNPLVSVILSLVVLREKISRLQWLAICLAAAGVGYLTLQHGGLPWIALTLAFTFGFYGLLKKTAPLGPLHGLAVETAVLAGPALMFLLGAQSDDGSDRISQGWTVSILLAGTGVITALPLLLYAKAAQSIKLSTLGLLQYISPTCGLFLGVWAYGEPFPMTRLAGFSFIWLALMFSWLDIWLRLRRSTAK